MLLLLLFSHPISFGSKSNICISTFFSSSIFRGLLTSLTYSLILIGSPLYHYDVCASCSSCNTDCASASADVLPNAAAVAPCPALAGTDGGGLWRGSAGYYLHAHTRYKHISICLDQHSTLHFIFLHFSHRYFSFYVL